ncbi:MAG: crossover junction endodeoxyribonuclease RuvC [Candidatus Cloacimonetes bacterium]|nr:crossover junction endodeoxyribonuclease RuvC [Candidatus Cloacimonadota bacterium]
MIILGVDPGSQICGYGLLDVDKLRINAAGCGVIESTGGTLGERLSHIYNEFTRIITLHQPELAAVETIFYGKNMNAAFTLGHARGAIILALAQQDIKIFEYSPREIKKSVVGNGSASKEQVAYMVQKILNLEFDARTRDATDALAAALCLHNKVKFAVAGLGSSN